MPHSTAGFSAYYLFYLPVDALLGLHNKHDWLVVHKEHLNEAHARAREYTEQKAAERVEPQRQSVLSTHCDVGPAGLLTPQTLG
jgi:hypothetical protein